MQKFLSFLILLVVTISFSQTSKIIKFGENGNNVVDKPVEQFLVSRLHSLVLQNDGSVVAWGRPGDASAVLIPEGTKNIKGIAVGNYSSYLIKEDGSVMSLVGSLEDRAPVGLRNVKKIVSYNNNYIALSDNGQLTTWGGGNEQPIIPKGLDSIVDVAMGGYYYLALRADGKISNLHSWNKDSDVFDTLTNVIAVAADYDHWLAIKNDGALVRGGATFYDLDVIPERLGRVKAIAAGSYFAAALTEIGELHVWGNLKYNSNTVRPSIVHNVKSISASWENLGVVFEDGSIRKWGINDHATMVPYEFPAKGVVAVNSFLWRELLLKDDGTVTGIGLKSVIIDSIPEGLTNVKAITSGKVHSVALKEDGMLVSWGKNSTLQGVNIHQKDIPIGLDSVSAVSAGDYHTLALRENGTVVAWGANDSLQSVVPIGLTGVKAISASRYFSAALKHDGTIVLWGGTGVWGSKLPAFESNIIDIAAGYSHILVLKEDSTVEAFGENSYKTLLVPEGLKDVVSIKAGHGFSAALTKSNKAVFWGSPNSLVPDASSWKPYELENVYKIEVGNISILAFLGDPLKNKKTNSVSGKVFSDNEKNCIRESNENGLAYSILKTVPGNNFTVTDLVGNYTLQIDTNSGSFKIEHVLNPNEKKFIKDECLNEHELHLNESDIDTCCFDFPYTVDSCSLMRINVSALARTRCFRSKTVVDYCNLGYKDVQGAEVKVIYPHYIVPISSSLKWSKSEGDTLIFSVGDLSKNQCGTIHIVDSVSCVNEGILGLTQCVSAEISPLSTCGKPSELMDSLKVSLHGLCDGGFVKFLIENSSENEMMNPSNYEIYVNDTLISQNTFQLDANTMLPIEYKADGNTLMIRGKIIYNNFDVKYPSLTVDGCSVDSSHHVSIYEGVLDNDTETEKDITCDVIVGSFDPNDKIAEPKGVSNKNYILAGTKLDYTIRFQNTGTADARRVVIIDTLDENLDFSTFLHKGASHNFVLEITGSTKPVVKYVFSAINLPDSSSNNLESHGFVSFSIATNDELVDESVIENKAAIYFDYNSPIFTNRVLHTIGNPYWTDFSRSNLVIEKTEIVTEIVRFFENVRISVYPNPAYKVISIDGYKEGDGFRLNNMTGETVLEFQLGMNSYGVESLKSGLYFYQLIRNTEVIERGKLFIE